MEKITLGTSPDAECATMQPSDPPKPEGAMTPFARVRSLLAWIATRKDVRASDPTQGPPPMKQTARQRPRHDRPLVEHAAERVGFAITAAEISDYTAALVPATTDHHAIPGESITQARQVRRMGLDLLTRAVLLERAQGCSWAQIAAALGESVEYTLGRWVPVEEEWRRDDKFSDRRKTIDESLLLPRRAVPTDDAAIRKAAAVLDEWCVSRRDPTIPSSEVQQPVTDGIVTDR